MEPQFRQYLPVFTDFLFTSAKDWTDWSASIQSTLLRHSLWRYIDGGCPCPSELVIDASAGVKSTTVTAKTTRINHNRRIISFIIASVTRTL